MIHVSLVGLLGACATAGTDPNQDPDSGTTSSFMDAGSSCGDRVIDPGEQCDLTNLGDATCQSQGYEGGLLACDPATCQFDVSNCYACGDGQLSGDEQCDREQLGGATCESQGYAGGTLGCNPDTCRFDTSECITTETLQNHDDACNTSLGCTNPEGTAGNPQSLVECFSSARLAPPFQLTQMSYIVSPDFPAPDALTLEVYSWSGAGLPGTRLTSIPLDPDDLASGSHTVTLPNPVEITTGDFCVGLGGADSGDGFRIMYSASSTVTGASWIKAANCDLNGFTRIPDVPGADLTMGNWCIGATIERAQ